jgi:hypothetical protein
VAASSPRGRHCRRSSSASPSALRSNNPCWIGLRRRTVAALSTACAMAASRCRRFPGNAPPARSISRRRADASANARWRSAAGVARADCDQFLRSGDQDCEAAGGTNRHDSSSVRPPGHPRRATGTRPPRPASCRSSGGAVGRPG